MRKLICVFILFIMVVTFIPVNVFAEENNLLVPNAVSSVLMNAENGEIIFSKDMDKKVAVASMTKMVAQIIILEEIEKKNI
mgnify:CR=1 FL=1